MTRNFKKFYYRLKEKWNPPRTYQQNSEFQSQQLDVDGKDLKRSFWRFITFWILKNLVGEESIFYFYNAGKNKPSSIWFNETWWKITYVGKTIGENTIDLRVEAIVKDNSVLLNLLEQIKEMEGVKDIIWSEIVSAVGRKISIPSFIIDKIG